MLKSFERSDDRSEHRDSSPFNYYFRLGLVRIFRFQQHCIHGDVHIMHIGVSNLAAVYCNRADLRSGEISHDHRKVRPLKKSQRMEVHHQCGRNGHVRSGIFCRSWSQLLFHFYDF